MHILLAFSGIPPRAVIMFIVASTAFGLILPRLILKTRFGLAAAFALHWMFYAAKAGLRPDLWPPCGQFGRRLMSSTPPSEPCPRLASKSSFTPTLMTPRPRRPGCKPPKRWGSSLPSC